MRSLSCSFGALWLTSIALLLAPAELKSLSVKDDSVYPADFTYLTKFCFGKGKGEVKFRFSESVLDGKHHFVLYMDKIWPEVLALNSCQEKLTHGGKGAIRMKLDAQHPDKLESDGYSTMKFSPYQSHSIIQHSRPHYWYAVLLNCDGNVDHHDPVHFDLQLLNDGNSHFSSDESAMLWFMSLVFLVMNIVSFFIGRRLQYHFKRRKPYFHPVIVVLAFALVLQYPSLLLRVLHLLVYSYDGVGTPMLYFLGRFLQEVSKTVLLILMSVISQGWTISNDELPSTNALGVLAAIATAFEFISLLVESWYHESHDSYSTAKEGILGCTFIALQLLFFAFFLKGAKKCIKLVEEQQLTKRRAFFLAFTFCCSIWLLAEPLLVLLTPLFATHQRYQIALCGSTLIQMIALGLLSRLFLWRSLYFEVSSMSASDLGGRFGS